MSQPEVRRQLNQQRGDIDGLYEIAERLESKVDSGFDELRGEVTAVRAELGAVSTQLDAVLELLRQR
ncbi:hypothetical protein [Pseudonocardia sp. KRD291]|uniref:hypothetical protein n=1 Tax=Pseudonocardia sp. KRD291 TaxID=2792007 RepID=UPI001C49DC8C|nr:hypothetical protein [Pseudonocardia sp. KRD291]MBW0102139.1 hypothetical protein [Pseudonocardia sp. KRD291]